MATRFDEEVNKFTFIWHTKTVITMNPVWHFFASLVLCFQTTYCTEYMLSEISTPRIFSDIRNFFFCVISKYQHQKYQSSAHYLIYKYMKKSKTKYGAVLKKSAEKIVIPYD